MNVIKEDFSLVQRSLSDFIQGFASGDTRQIQWTYGYAAIDSGKQAELSLNRLPQDDRPVSL